MLKNPTSLYIPHSEAGMLSEGRKDKWSGNTMTPSALLRYHKTRWIGLSQASVEWTNRPMMEVQYEVELKSFFPFSMLYDDLSDLKRLETLSFWHSSYQEEIRHLELINDLITREWYHEFKELADSYKDQIVAAFEKYVNMIVSEGDMSFEHWRYYVKEHEDSASPYQGKKWKDILRDQSWMKKSYVDINKWIINFNNSLKSIMSVRKPLIHVENVYPALRARPADYEVIEQSNDILRVKCRKVRDRKAGGVRGLSQLEYPLFKKDIKKKVYNECFYNLITEIVGCEVVPINIYGAKFYKLVAEDNPFCYDLRNAEKLVGHILSYLPTNVDLGHPEYDRELAGEMYSGIGPTRPLAEIVVAIIVKFLLIKFGIQPSRLFIGGDNFGFTIEFDCKEAEVDILMTNETSILGFLPGKKKFGPLSLVTDNINQRANIPLKWDSLTWTQSFQYELRPLQVIVDNDLYKPGTCMKKIAWVVEADLSHEEIYSRDSLNEALMKSEELHTKFYDMFAEELNFVKHFIPTHQNQNKSTNAHLSVVRR
jgi:hypothetical protein